MWKAGVVGIVVIAMGMKTLWKEFSDYIQDASPDNFIERTDDDRD